MGNAGSMVTHLAKQQQKLIDIPSRCLITQQILQMSRGNIRKKKIQAQTLEIQRNAFARYKDTQIQSTRRTFECCVLQRSITTKEADCLGRDGIVVGQVKDH